MCISVEPFAISKVTDSPALTERTPGENAKNATSCLSLPARTTLPFGVSAASRLASLTVLATCCLTAFASLAFEGAFAPFGRTLTLPFMPGWIEQRYV